MYLGFGQLSAVSTFHPLIKDIPLEPAEHAAVMDGATKVQVFAKTVPPLLEPILFSVMVLEVLWIWKDYLLPSLVLLSSGQRTSPLCAYSLFMTSSVDFAPSSAGIVLSVLSAVVVLLMAH